MRIAGDARQWFAARDRAARIERDLTRTAVAKTDPIGLAFDLIAVVEHLHGWPLPLDPVSVRENEAVRETWTRMRRNWAIRRR